IVLVLSNRSDAQGIHTAAEAGIETSIIKKSDYDSRESFEEALDIRITESEARLICLAGFLWLLGESFVNNWRDRLINIHPSLLPAFKGLHVQDQAVEMGVRFTGCSVHFVRPELDDGPIIAQAVVPVLPSDDGDSLSARILVQEHQIYPRVVKWIADGRVRVSGEKVLISGVEMPDQSFISPYDAS
ncbi:MAG: phosphoribosylglycinamide formyltransferase, partial [Rhodospirillales bacterium]|nr:phosphoribosylglycinamide formyltransferase [Rhodospirillales bacterium]